MVTTEGSLCSQGSLDRCHACFPERSITDWRLRDLHIRGALAGIDCFIAPSQFLRDRFVRWGIPSDRITVVPNGLPQTAAAPVGTPRRRNRFGFFGHINRFKGATVALEASALLSQRGIEHTLTLHGSTAHQAKEIVEGFQAACARAPQARYRGSYQRFDLPRLMASIDWVLFPSQWWENAPLVIQEAFQHRRPVLCSDIGGAAELVQHGVNGLHFAVGDPHALADVMQETVEKDGLWHRLSAGITAPWSIDECAARHVALYESLRVSSVPELAA